jgi:hypothetical protein
MDSSDRGDGMADLPFDQRDRIRLSTYSHGAG